VLFARDAHHERGDVHELLADGDVSLVDQHTGVVGGACELSAAHERLESALHELSDSQTQHEIKFALLFGQETETHHSADKGLTY